VLRINPNLWPPAGWQFTHSGIHFSAPDRAQLVAQVARHYALHSIAGDASADIEAQLCADNEQLCRESDTPVRGSAQAHNVDETLTQRRLAWLDSTYQLVLGERKSPGVFVNQDEADRRSRICKECPQNVADPSGCTACVASSGAMRTQIVNASKLRGIRSGPCHLSGVDLPVAARVSVNTSDSFPLPAHCWRKPQ